MPCARSDARCHFGFVLLQHLSFSATRLRSLSCLVGQAILVACHVRVPPEAGDKIACPTCAARGGITMLELRNVSKSFSSISVVDNVSFSARPGEITGYL